jgi:regulatory protein
LRRQDATQRASAALAVRDRSRAGLDAVLERRGVAPLERAAALETMSRLGYLDDRRYANDRAATLAGRGYGDEAIRFELGRDEVSGEIVEAAIAALEPELQRARRRSRPGERAREARSLAARGFSAETIETLFGSDD